jgi:hypothetical protein
MVGALGIHNTTAAMTTTAPMKVPIRNRGMASSLSIG